MSAERLRNMVSRTTKPLTITDSLAMALLEITTRVRNSEMVLRYMTATQEVITQLLVVEKKTESMSEPA